MLKDLKQSLQKQFGASIEMLENVIQACPREYYQNQKRFYYLAFHSVIFLDYYLTIPPQNFSPLLDFTIQSPKDMPPEALGDVLPKRHYPPEELLAYLSQIKTRAFDMIEDLDEDSYQVRFVEGEEPGDMNYSLLEIVLYNLRHTQHHVGQLQMLLSQAPGKVPAWVFRAQGGC